MYLAGPTPIFWTVNQGAPSRYLQCAKQKCSTCDLLPWPRRGQICTYCCLIKHQVPSCRHLHLTRACCIQCCLASALWVLTAQSLVVSSAPYAAAAVLLTSDDGCGKPFLLRQDPWLARLTLTLMAALLLVKVGSGADPNVSVASFLQPVVLWLYPSWHWLCTRKNP